MTTTNYADVIRAHLAADPEMASLVASLGDYPDVICLDCGTKHGRGPVRTLSTTYPGVCGICGREATVTEPRDFGHLKPEWRQAGEAAIGTPQ